MKVQINSDAVFTRRIARGDKPALVFRDQKAAVLRDDDFPLPFSVGLDEDQSPYPPGLYEIDPASVQLNQYGGLDFARRIVLRLVEKRLATPSKA